jgi:hypothetical protein
VQETVQIAMVVASRDEKTAIAETIGEYDMNKAKWVSKVVGRLCVVVVAGFPSVTQAQDSWTSIDKANHFAYSAYLSSAAVKSHGNVVGIALALVPGVVKEMSDLAGSGVPSMRDRCDVAEWFSSSTHDKSKRFLTHLLGRLLK